VSEGVGCGRRCSALLGPLDGVALALAMGLVECRGCTGPALLPRGGGFKQVERADRPVERVPVRPSLGLLDLRQGLLDLRQGLLDLRQGLLDLWGAALHSG